jgi:hypothetical protein
MTKLIVDGTEIDVPPECTRSSPASRLNLDELLDRFEKLTHTERLCQIAEANAYLKANGIDSLSRLDEWTHR